MTLGLNKVLETLDVQPMKKAQQIARDTRGEWYVVGFPIFMDVIKRNLDIGEDGTVKSITYDGEGLAMPVPKKQWEHHGFKMTLEILPKGYQSRRIRKLLDKDRVTPEHDFKIIMDFIEQDAHKRGYDVIR